MANKTVFISGGGTGGHFYPALAVAQQFHKNGYKVVFIGTKNGIEKEKDFPYGEKILLDTKGVRGKSFINAVKGIFSLLKATYFIIRLIKKEKPDYSISFGGYVSLPLGIASFLTKTPLYIHEQNSIPSYTNIILSKFSKKIFITFEITKKYFKNAIHCGLPLREKIKQQINLSKEEARKIIGINKDEKVIFVIGGSQGAKKLISITTELAKQLKDFKFILITGKHNIEEKPENLIDIKYTEDVGLYLRACDLVISRAGASTVNEIMASGRYAIYIPFPYAVSDHQYYNVKWLKELNLAEILREEEIDIQKLKNTVEKSININVEKELKSLVKLDTAEFIFNEITKSGNIKK
ncbi:undecaprenyldiphospho-muramoylpentapeptide beta-N-acetylglucosaminyltransferase [Venenivibrio stagnispumantis]|uniref:UDP-N-acetylglucosamine--N-acetylmuramyl-(pentapeptide) pyrophosphoryl-undecaprenol N-acetylglucosamine transferase n=1 Tax=Venenivibrio stagnispumantis TaxID=407998 RepID=A0AA45WIW0_9AQUI|nr:undecaprenyldiphospho-muramoylpentapeptide beta-N-acetylglucosaminyltransferase [Venenivibrio stagnispumantis]MCW4573937.1 undecaprenyldiphospho-muramoylpentapeptide beta-N-acetylglucosaminyltransferase [Venenivibrio stagnispumantis]SMP01080.1 UDP-N-acetylglucosamine-N-acetylmuramylpentapeptide N-acetylglucosamine transferase [Venenivibrio stagnispumantis]